MAAAHACRCLCGSFFCDTFCRLSLFLCGFVFFWCSRLTLHDCSPSRIHRACSFFFFASSFLLLFSGDFFVFLIFRILPDIFICSQSPSPSPFFCSCLILIFCPRSSSFSFPSHARQVAKELNADMILVANGGLGSTYDELELNRGICEKYGIEVRGVILNKVKSNCCLNKELWKTRYQRGNSDCSINRALWKTRYRSLTLTTQYGKGGWCLNKGLWKI